MIPGMPSAPKAAAHRTALPRVVRPSVAVRPSAAVWLRVAAGLALPLVLAGPLLAQGAATLTLTPPAAPPTAPAARATPDAAMTPTRVVVVHWKIKHGREEEFLDYWAQRSVVEDRSGLIGEFLSSVEDRARFPWINMQAVGTGYTSFFNVGIWRDAAAFEGQIGKYIDLNLPPLPFEADRRERVFLQPERWRIGGSALSLADQPGVK